MRSRANDRAERFCAPRCGRGIQRRRPRRCRVGQFLLVATALAVGAGGVLRVSEVPAGAHTTLPAYLELTEVVAGSFELVWRVPTVEGPPPAIFPILPPNCSGSQSLSAVQALGSVFTRGMVTCGAEGLLDREIEIGGLRTTIMDVLVRVTLTDGTTVSRVLRGQEPSFVVTKTDDNKVDAIGHFRLGLDHILSGIDHLLFVLGLLLIVDGTGRLLKAITAFTVAHSMTLALAALGVVRVSPAPIEAVIALSIVFLAVELAQYQRGLPGVTYRKPWLVAFSFGLLHGFGFAGTLSQIGLPPGDIPRALLFFNVGVEAGQVGFIVACLALFGSWRALGVHAPMWMRTVSAYGIGSVASFWFLQRCALILAS